MGAGRNETWYSTYPWLSTLSLNEKVIFCDLKSEEAKPYQLKLTEHLANIFKNGSPEATIDLKKAAQYEKQNKQLRRDLGLAPLEPELAPEASSEDIASDSEPENPSRARKFFSYASKQFLGDPRTTEFYYNRLGWWTSTRLFFLRANRFFNFWKKSFLPSWFSYFGLSYGFELIADIVVVLYTTFRPGKTEEEKNLSYARRFLNVLRKDNRPIRMANAAVWLGVNLAALFVTGGLSIALNIAAFAFDVGVELYRTAKSLFHHWNLYKKIDQEIEEKQIYLDLKQWEYNQEIIKTGTFNQVMTRKYPTSGPEYEAAKARALELNNKIVSLKNEIKDLEKIKTEIVQHAKSTAKTNLYPVFVTTTILVGMILFWYPPTTVAGICMIVGAVLALGGGSIIGGFGRRVWNKAKNFFTGMPQMPEEKEKPPADPQLDNSFSKKCSILINNDPSVIITDHQQKLAAPTVPPSAATTLTRSTHIIDSPPPSPTQERPVTHSSNPILVTQNHSTMYKPANTSPSVSPKNLSPGKVPSPDRLPYPRPLLV